MNTRADALSKMASSGIVERGNIFTEILSGPSIKREEMVQIEEEPNWMDPIMQYLRDGTLPSDRKEARRLIARAAHYIYDGQALYKRSFSWPLLKCLRPSVAELTMREVHKEICGDHSSGKVLAHKILRRGFFWPTLQQDASNFVRKFGIPRVLVTDNGTQFASRQFKDFRGRLYIEQKFTSVGHPQANGQVEVTNRTLLQGLKKRVENTRGLWAEESLNLL
ncbi:uncharacterized protein LOC143858455 [Tasmannia lanceolata]|uniref:uncharacterized protein LOC143858455 n=1 Tax=Tasmannia lanceolata TaxID=3420 RepID=UPI0040642F95